MSTLLFDTIKTQAKITDTVIVSFSGGKDSIVVMDLCFKYFKKVYPFFMYLVPDLEFQQKTIRWYEHHYNTNIIQVPHMGLGDCLRYGSFCASDVNVDTIEINDIYNYVRNLTGAYWIAAGERITDSLVRRAMIKSKGTIDKVRGRFFPIANWRKRDVMEYIKYHKLYLPLDSRKLGFSFGGIEPEELAVIKEVFPEDYEKILHVFPLSDVGVRRLELYGKKQISKLRDTNDKSTANKERILQSTCD